MALLKRENLNHIRMHLYLAIDTACIVLRCMGVWWLHMPTSGGTCLGNLIGWFVRRTLLKGRAAPSAGTGV
jgi:hypothetical protein